MQADIRVFSIQYLYLIAVPFYVMIFYVLCLTNAERLEDARPFSSPKPNAVIIRILVPEQYVLTARTP